MDIFKTLLPISEKAYTNQIKREFVNPISLANNNKKRRNGGLAWRNHKFSK